MSRRALQIPPLARLLALIPALYLVLALAAAAVLIWATPPFMMADEQTHLMRANTLTFGPAGLHLAQRPDGAHMVGQFHQSVVDAAAPFNHVRFRAEEKAHAADFAAAAAPRLDARRGEHYVGEALNPAFYLPSAFAVAWGRHYGWTVLDTLYLARVLDALATVALGALALSLAGRARIAIFAVLLLPMSTALMSAVSQDGPLLGTAALAAALLSRAIAQGRPLKRWEALAYAAAIALVALAKPPYAAFALLLWLAPAQDRRAARLASLAAVLLPLAWALGLEAAHFAPPDPPGLASDPVRQAEALLAAPARLVPLVQETFRLYGEHYADQAIGVLGWLDTALPLSFYPAAWTMLGIALALTLGRLAPKTSGWAAVQALVIPLGLICAAGVFLALYLSWSAVGGPVIDGVQGRYLLPIALMLPLALEGPGQPWDAGPARRLIGWAAHLYVCAFPLASLAVLGWTLAQRFYMS